MAEQIHKRMPRDWVTAQAGAPQVFRSGKSTIFPEITVELLTEAYKNPERARLIVELFKPKSAMAMPLRTHGKVLGVLTLVSCESGKVYTQADLEFAEEVALRAGAAIENAILFRQAQQAIAARDEFLSHRQS